MFSAARYRGTYQCPSGKTHVGSVPAWRRWLRAVHQVSISARAGYGQWTSGNKATASMYATLDVGSSGTGVGVNPREHSVHIGLARALRLVKTVLQVLRLSLTAEAVGDIDVLTKTWQILGVKLSFADTSSRPPGPSMHILQHRVGFMTLSSPTSPGDFCREVVAGRRYDAKDVAVVFRDCSITSRFTDVDNSI